MEGPNSILFEQTALEEERVQRQTISVDTGHLLGATSFQIVDVRAKQEIQTKGKLAMQQAKSKALMHEDLGRLEESRKKLAKEIIRKEQVAKDQATKERNEEARMDQLEKEQAAKTEARLKAEEAQRVEANKKEERDRNSWSAVATSSTVGLKATAKVRVASKNWPQERDLQLVLKDDVPENKNKYK
jgi:hypothetical protein